MTAHQEAGAIIREHLGIRYITDGEVRAVMTDLQRQAVAGDLSPRDSELAQALGVSGRLQ